MSRHNGSENIQPAGEGSFASTHWSVVWTAAQTRQPDALQALDKLCAAYWYPLYAYLRRRGSTPHEAEDLVQEFFARRVVTKLVFKGLNPEAGKFRTWLLNSLQHLACNERDRQNAKKRGGGEPPLSLNVQDAEGRYLVEPGHCLTPQRIYERAWALTLLERALALLQQQYEREGKAAAFAELKCFLPGALPARPYAEVATRLGKSEQAVKMAVSRLRQEYGRLLRAEIGRTVSSSNDVDDEMRNLMAALVD